MKKLILLILIVAVAIGFLFFKEKSFDNNIIYIGSSLPKTGTIKELGNAVELGTNAYFHHINTNNLLNNKKIKLVAYEDKYEPQLTLQNIKKLIKDDKIFALYGFVGTPTVKNILPILRQTDIPFIAAFTGASFLRDDYYENIINFRSSYQQEIEEQIKYLHNKKGFTKIAVFYQNDEYGEDGYISVVNTLKKYNLSLVAEGSYKRNTLSIRHAFHAINNAKPEAIIMVGANKANTLFIKKAKKNKNFKNTIFCNISFGDASAMIKKLDGHTKNILFSQVVPSYNNLDIPIIKEYHKILKAYDSNYEAGFISLEAFLNAKIVVTALKNIKGSITRSKFIEELKKIPQNTLKGLKIEYKNQQLFNKVYLFKYENNNFIKVEE